MTESASLATTEVRYELRFAGLFNRGHGYAFPCDAQGHVDIDVLTERARANYLLARAAVGTDFLAPVVALMP